MKKFKLIAGPCVIEDFMILSETYTELSRIAKDLDIEFVDTQEKFDKLIEEKGAAVALTTDGFAEIIEDGKTKIVINESFI